MHDNNEVLTAGAINPAELLDQAKNEMHERSRSTGYLDDLGELGAGSPAELWTGNASVAKRLKSGEISQADIDHGFEMLELAYVEVSAGAAKRCVEDRPPENYDDNDPRSVSQPLGPQLQGGTADEALAYRLARGYEDGATLVGDVAEVAENSPSNFAPGAHRGPHATGVDCTDCGAIDNEEDKVALYNGENAAPYLAAKLEAVFGLAGKAFDPGIVGNLQANAKGLEAVLPQYMDEHSSIVDAIEKLNPNGVPTVRGNHKPAFCVLDFVKGETLNTGHYDALTQDKIYALNLDVWNLFEEKSDQEAANIIAGALTTLMRITDGSVHLVARRPRTDSDTAATTGTAA